MEKQRLQKILANMGHGSRRSIESMIKKGVISINGARASLGDKVDAKNDVISINGVTLSAELKIETKILLYNKPRGEISTSSDELCRRTVFDRLPVIKFGKWINIGRLDKATCGLLIFTNNGRLHNSILHPSLCVEREYIVICNYVNNITSIKKTLEKGIELEDGYAYCKNVKIKKHPIKNILIIKLVVTEGRNRLIRRIFSRLMMPILRLQRVRIGDLELPSELKTGNFVMLKEPDIKKLCKQYNCEYYF